MCHGQITEVRPPKNAWPERLGSPSPAGDTEIFAIMSAAHELKTPLVVMLGYAELLRRGTLGAINDRQQEVLGEIYQSGERLQRLIRDLVHLYQLRAARSPAMRLRETEAAAVNDHVREIFEYWAPVARQKSMAYRFQPGPGTPLVRIDPCKIQNIVSNLIENALKYSPEGACVAVSVASCFWERRRAHTLGLFTHERKTSRRTRNAVRIDVTDTGPGIAPEHHEDIFWDFVQLSGAPARGTGLGLAIARRLTQACGGALWVESEPGKGSRFSLLLAQTGQETRNECATEHTARG
jgi:signal transduction histidine kinase